MGSILRKNTPSRPPSGHPSMRGEFSRGKVADVAGDVNRRIGRMLFCSGRIAMRQKEGGLTVSKRMLLGLLIGMMVVAVPAMAATESAETVSIEITVTCSPPASVWIGDNTYAFGYLTADTLSVAATSIAVDNDSLGLTEKYALRASNARNNGTHATPLDWTLAATRSNDTYTLSAQFNSTRPVASFNGNADDDFNLTTDNQNCDGTLFLGDQDGHDIVSTAVPEHLWFEIGTPNSVTDTNLHTIFVTIVALGM